MISAVICSPTALEVELHLARRVVRLAGPSRFGVEFTELGSDVPTRITRYLETVDPS